MKKPLFNPLLALDSGSSKTAITDGTDGATGGDALDDSSNPMNWVLPVIITGCAFGLGYYLYKSSTSNNQDDAELTGET